MDDQLTDDRTRQPIWPPDPLDQFQSATPTPPRFPTPVPNFTDFTPTYSVKDVLSEVETARVPAPPRLTGAPASRMSVSDTYTEQAPTLAPKPDPSEAPTAHLTYPPISAPTLKPDPSEAPTARLTAPPVNAASRTALPAPQPVRPAESSPQPPAPMTLQTLWRALVVCLAWSVKHWRLVTTGLVVVSLAALAWSTYARAEALAAQPNKLVANYCAALKGDDFTSAYALLTPALQQQTPEAQYLADANAREAISGKITACNVTPEKHLTPLSFLSNPRALVFTMTETRGGVTEKGQIALTRDATGWHVAGYSANLVGIDLGPLHTAQALCQAFLRQNYDAAYALLSAPYQTEQGNKTAFSQAFGKNIRVAGCAASLRNYTVDKADQHASFQMTLDIAATGNGFSTKFTVPADVTLVRESDGWRVDSISPTSVS